MDEEEITVEKKRDEKIGEFARWFHTNRLMVIAAVLMLVGLVLSFDYLRIGSFFVGFALGIAFFDELQNYFIQLKDFYSVRGLFKTMMLIGLVIYVLIAIPIFVIALALGFVAIYLLRRMQ